MITWTIPMTEYTKADGGIFTAHWRVTAVDGDYSATAYSTCGFTPDPTAPDFVPYENLTEADVLSWVWDSVDKAEIEASLATQIEEQKTPATTTGLPW